MPAHDHDTASTAANTVATVAGSSIAITEEEEDASSLAAGGGAASDAGDDDVNNVKAVLMTRASSCSLDISLANDDGGNDGDVAAAAAAAAVAKEEEEEEEAYTAPMHLHALRAPAKLRGAPPRSRSSSRSRPGSRRNSSSPPRNLSALSLGELVVVGGTLSNSTISPSISVGSSLDGIANNSNDHHQHHHHRHHSSQGDNNSILIDRDILLDKLGFQDLDPDISHGDVHEMLRKHNSLPTLNERMSEETMDDVHAFQNLTFCKRPSTGSSTGSITTEELSSELMMMPGITVGGEDASSSSPERAASREGSTTKMMGNKSLNSPAALQLNTLDEEEEEGVDDDDDDDDDTGGAIEDEGRRGEDQDVLDIPDGVIHLRDKPILNGAFTSSIATLGVLSSTACDDDEDNDEEDDENAEVEVPTSIIEELDINEGKRKFLHRDTSLMVVGGNDMDFLEDDEQDGLEADLTNEGEEPR